MITKKLNRFFALLALVGACGSEDPAQEAEAAAALEQLGEQMREAVEEAAEEAAEPTLPSESATLALAEVDGAFPLTIGAPTGSTTFLDNPPAIFVRHTAGFGVQVKERNRFNGDLEGYAAELRENRLGMTNTILEESEGFLLWSSARAETEYLTHGFRILSEIGDKTWVCSSDSRGTWTRAQVDRGVEACRTLAAAP